MVILGKYADNELLKRVLYMANSGRVKFYAKQIPEYTCDGNSTYTLEESLNMIQKISSREYTGHNAINFLKEILCGSTRDNAYVIATDRGELYPTIETQVNVTGQQQFQNRLQDTVRPTTKETTIYTYDGAVAPVTKAQALYTQFIPQYTKIGEKTVRVGGSSNYGLKSATDYSYFPGASTTGINNSVLQNPDVTVNNLWKRPDFNVDGPGTFKEARPDGSKYQNYRLITKPTTNGLKLDYNLETENSDLHSYSPLLGKKINEEEW
jgi:hypothetical protein